MSRLLAVLLLLGVAVSTSACIIEEPGGGHHRCWNYGCR